MRYQSFYVSVVLLACASSMSAIGFDEFDQMFAGGNDPFANFDFGGSGGDFGSMFGGDDFGDLFGGGGGGFGDMFSGTASWEQPAPTKKEQPKQAAPNANDPGAVFTTSFTEKEKPLPQHYKDAARTYMATLSSAVETLHAKLSSIDVGIVAKDRLAPLLPTVTKVVEQLELIQSRSPYMQTLYKTDFAPLRTTIMNLPGTLHNLAQQLEQASSFSETFNAPSKQQVRKQESALSEAEHLVAGTLTKLHADLQKVSDHQETKQGLEGKKQKEKQRSDEAAQRAASSSGGSGGYGGDWSGGWGDDWSGSVGGGWEQPHMQTGGWSDAGGDFWGDDFGSGFSSGWGGGSDWGGWDAGGGSYNAWGGNDSSSSSAGSSLSGGMGTGGGVSYTSPLIAGQTEKKKDIFETMPLQHDGVDATPAAVVGDQRPQRLVSLITKVEKKLVAWRDDFELGNDATGSFFHELLADKAFAQMLGDLRSAGGVYKNLKRMPSNNWSHVQQQSVARFADTLGQAAPFLIAASKYAPPLLSELQELVAGHKAVKKGEKDTSKEAFAKNIAQRKQARERIVLLLKDIREDDVFDCKPDFDEALLEYDEDKLTELEAFMSKYDNLSSLGHKELAMLTRISQSLLRQPVALSYVGNTEGSDSHVGADVKGKPQTKENKTSGPPPLQAPDPLDAPAQTLDAPAQAGVKEKEQAPPTPAQRMANIRPRIKDFIAKKFELRSLLFTILTKAVKDVSESMKKKDLKDKTVIAAITAHVKRAIASEYAKSPYRTQLEKLLLPFRMTRLQEVSLDYHLVHNVQMVWKKELETADERQSLKTHQKSMKNAQQKRRG